MGGEWHAARLGAAAVILFGQNFPNFERRKVSIDIRSYTTYYSGYCFVPTRTLKHWVCRRSSLVAKKKQKA